MAIGKMFNGKKFVLTRQFDSKAEVNDYVKWLKNNGYLSRIVKTNKAKKYHVYRRVRR